MFEGFKAECVNGNAWRDVTANSFWYQS